MVIGAGAGVFILETEELARARGAVPLVELVGYGTSSDAKDHVRPDAAAPRRRYASRYRTRTSRRMRSTISMRMAPDPWSMI